MRERILETTRRLLQDQGLARLTIKAIADELDVTKQAVLYWFPSKNRLLQEFYIEAIEKEARFFTSVIEAAASGSEAVERFLKQGFAYHADDFAMFRLVYLLPQLERSAQELIDKDLSAQRIYPETSKFYDALEEKLAAAPGLPDNVDPRTLAVSLHMSLIGHICVAGQMEATDDSFKQTFEEMLEALCALVEACLG
jgi:AcrR family transcriptional regulator